MIHDAHETMDELLAFPLSLGPVCERDQGILWGKVKEHTHRNKGERGQSAPLPAQFAVLGHLPVLLLPRDRENKMRPGPKKKKKMPRA